MISEATLLDIDLFGEDKDDAGVRMRSSRMVTTRKPQTCRFSKPHNIPIGHRARVEEAILDNKWGRFYVCAPCLISWVEEWG
ncbi:hypothetical protein LCGC14_0295310 [marine sediment metagenome]|uniref:Uncharacterized protein n=1 Tax=marine sediment metagenome TaxID=412755 RepID=A0A0F9WXY4_9ZZZZ